MKQYLNLIILIIFVSLISLQVSGQTQIGETIETSESYASIAESVGLSGDGNRIVVGAYGKSTWGFKVFSYDGSSWEQLGEDIPIEYPNNISSHYVTISADGNRVAVGEVVSKAYSPDNGSVKVYEFDGQNWNQLGNTLYSYTNSDFFGARVSLSASGNRLIVSSKFFNNSTGNARVFEYDGSDWNQLGDDLIGDQKQHYFGTIVNISKDGNLVAIGQNQYMLLEEEVPEDGPELIIASGLVRVFEYDGANWIQVGQDITGNGGEASNFGVSISLSSSGNKIAVGAPQTLSRRGYSEVYDYNGSEWVQNGTRIYGENVGERFGNKVLLSEDGSRLAVQSSPNGYNSERLATVKLYEVHNSDWAQVGVDILGDDLFDNFGRAMSFSENGNTIAIGALKYEYMESGMEVGYAKVFDLNNLTLSVENIEVQKMLLYPNPASEIVRVLNSQDVKSVQIYSSSGKFVDEKFLKDEMLDVSNLPRGFYILRLLTSLEENISLKLIKN